MSIRLKIVLIIVPLIVAMLLLTGASSYFAASNGITRIAKDFLGFKALELQNQAGSQWRLLVENNLTEKPEMVAATQAAVEGYARSIVRSATELIVAVDEEGALRMSTSELRLQGEEQQRLSELARGRSSDLVTVSMGGRDRVAKGFWFEPFKWYVLVSEERAAFYDQVNQIAERTVMILAGSIVAGVLLVLMFTGYLMRPLRRVVGTMKEIISTNDLSKRVVVEYHDEIGQLAQTFNLMVGELEKAYRQIKGYAYTTAKNRKREENARARFQQYVPPDVIEMFFQNPEGMLKADNSQVAVLFSDIRSFTSISEQMKTPDVLVSSLNRYFGIMVDIVMNHNGIIDKYIGDAIKALFGAPIKRDEDVMNAVRAGLEMIEGLKTFNADQEARGMLAWKTGIGIHYGVATVGNIGTETKMDFTAIGDTVTIASQLEGLTKTYHQPLIISASVHRKVKDELPCRLLDAVPAKGMPNGLRIYAIKASLTRNEREGWGAHNMGMAEYFDRNFSRAAGYFRDALKQMPGDEMAQMMLQRSQAYAKSPPPESWRGFEAESA